MNKALGSVAITARTHRDLFGIIACEKMSTVLGAKPASFDGSLIRKFILPTFIKLFAPDVSRSQVSNKVIVNSKMLHPSSVAVEPMVYRVNAFFLLLYHFFPEKGKMPLLCASFSNSSPALLTLDPDSASAKSLTWQAGFFFVTTWICFAVGEILLLARVSVESGHLKNWSKPKPSCLTIREGLFCVAGVFALTTVFLASALYLTALRALRISQEQENWVVESDEIAILREKEVMLQQGVRKGSGYQRRKSMNCITLYSKREHII
ncbi:hypothetical protein JHK87_019596 [Glycine soja]|nr:hypothetical protein JHK87_019596 [Glycine soja]